MSGYATYQELKAWRNQECPSRNSPRGRALLISQPSGCRGRNMALQPHGNGEVAVMLVIVGDVVHQHSAPESIGRPRANNMRDLHRLGELSVGGRRVHAIAIDERIVQRLNEYSLVSDLLVVRGRRRLFA